MKVKDYLPKVKASRYTYYNLDEKTKNDFQRLYNYLKRNKDKELSIYYKWCDGLKIDVEHWLNRCDIEYLRKYKTMEVIRDLIIWNEH